MQQMSHLNGGSGASSDSDVTRAHLISELRQKLQSEIGSHAPHQSMFDMSELLKICEEIVE